MNGLARYLYQFVLENRLDSLKSDKEYQKCIYEVNLQIERVEGDLAPEQRRELHKLIDQISVQNGIEGEHIFLAALALSRELHTLVQV
ncbi:hypothetical protein N510_003089 [Firmicutes bacterium ASF500]|nr:hypothetical protein N510_003089 [Firmicutes bacterium ASF500]